MLIVADRIRELGNDLGSILFGVLLPGKKKCLGAVPKAANSSHLREPLFVLLGACVYSGMLFCASFSNISNILLLGCCLGKRPESEMSIRAHAYTMKVRKMRGEGKEILKVYWSIYEPL